MILEIAACGLLAYILWFFFLDNDSTFPPGPKGLPFIGAIPQYHQFLDVGDAFHKIRPL